MSLVRKGESDGSAKTFSDNTVFPVALEPGEYVVSARKAEDIQATFEKTYQVSTGGSLVVELPLLPWSSEHLRVNEVRALVADRLILENNLRFDRGLETGLHVTGWITFGIGVAELAVCAYFLVDGLISQGIYYYSARLTCRQTAAFSISSFGRSH